MLEEESSPELLSFYTLLDNAFPLTMITVGYRESQEAYANEVLLKHFNGQDWRLVDFPDNENSFIVEAFEMLDGTSKLYYIAAYMRESIIDSYYQSGCLSHLRSFCNVPGGLLSRMDAYQRESIIWYLDMVEEEINSMGMMDRLAHAVDTISAKHIRNTIRNTVW